MKYHGLLFFFLPLAAAAVITLACGSPKPIVPNCGAAAAEGNTTGVLTSITVCPATADARNYSGGQVQFVATGYFSTPPSPVTPLKAFWGACYQNAPTNAVAITNTGMVQCAAGSEGTYSVFASIPTNCEAISACGGGCQVSGYAELTCP